ncbi:MAG: LysR family transcriptional regulator [Burkholderiaceae bacterium]
MPIKIELLRTFAAVAEAGNISDAAATLSRTPAAISMSLKQLERELGGSLFEGDRKNQLTELGRFTHEVANNQLGSYERAIGSIKAFARNETGHISLACVHCQAVGLLPTIVQRFLADRSDATLELTWDESDQIAERVADQAIDLGLCAEPRSSHGLVFEPLMADPFHVWFSSGSPLARLKRPLNWRDLRHQSLLRNQVSDSLSTETYRNLASRSKLRIQDPACLVDLIATGGGIAILPVLPAIQAHQRINHLPLNDHRARRRLGLLRNGNAPALPGVEIISDMIRNAVRTGLTAVANRDNH